MTATDMIVDGDYMNV